MVNHRQGWNAPLTEELQCILDKYGNKNEIDLKEYISRLSNFPNY